MERRIIVTKNLQELSQQAAAYCLEKALRAVATQGKFFLVLAGGSTPSLLYQRLSSPPLRQQMPWSQTHLFFADERSVASTHAHSNVAMAYATLIDRIDIPQENVHIMRAELASIRQHAWRYAQDIAATVPQRNGVPQFDLVLLGMGEDGHTASLFPETPILHEQRWVAANYVEKLNTWRVSMTYPLLNHSLDIAILAAGENKAAIVREVLHTTDAPRYPIQAIRPQRELTWFLDQAAASRMTSL